MFYSTPTFYRNSKPEVDEKITMFYSTPTFYRNSKPEVDKNITMNAM